VTVGLGVTSGQHSGLRWEPGEEQEENASCTGRPRERLRMLGSSLGPAAGGPLGPVLGQATGAAVTVGMGGGAQGQHGANAGEPLGKDFGEDSPRLLEPTLG
jgi:hypothetical protein